MKVSSITKLLAGCIPKGLVSDSRLALASVAQSLLDWRNVFVDDLRRYREAKLRILEAKTASEEAKAQKDLAEAAAATNKVTAIESEKAKIELQLEREAIRNRIMDEQRRKITAEADAAEANNRNLPEGNSLQSKEVKSLEGPKTVTGLGRESDGNSVRKPASSQSLIEVYEQARTMRIAAAVDELREALKQLKSEGGGFYTDLKNLKEITDQNGTVPGEIDFSKNEEADGMEPSSPS